MVYGVLLTCAVLLFHNEIRSLLSEFQYFSTKSQVMSNVMREFASGECNSYPTLVSKRVKSVNEAGK